MDDYSADTGGKEPDEFDLDAFLRDNHFLDDETESKKKTSRLGLKRNKQNATADPPAASAATTSLSEVKPSALAKTTPSAGKPLTGAAGGNKDMPGAGQTQKKEDESRPRQAKDIQDKPQRGSDTLGKPWLERDRVEKTEAEKDLKSTETSKDAKSIVARYASHDVSKPVEKTTQKTNYPQRSPRPEADQVAGFMNPTPDYSLRSPRPEANKGPLASEQVQKTKGAQEHEAPLVPKEDTNKPQPSNTQPNSKPQAPKASPTKPEPEKIMETNKVDLGATMSYEALGEDYPEIPLVSEAKKEATVKKAPAKRPRSSSEANPQTAKPTDNPDASWSNLGMESKHKPSVLSAPRRTAKITTMADVGDYHQAGISDNAYRIRGGGKRHNKRTPLLVIVIALVAIVGIGLTGFFFKNSYGTLMVQKPAEQVITLTSTDTRQAIDAQMPQLLDNLNLKIDKIFSGFTDQGLNVVMNDQASSDNPDPTSTGGEIIDLAPGVSQDVLQGYYVGEFDAYDFTALQADFNGAWMLDVSQGDSGSYAQIKYINFAADSLDGELSYLMQVQQLSGDNSVIDSQGTDEFGNSYIQGYLVIDDNTYYWKVVGIPFSDYYGGQDTRQLPDTTVFVKCTIASFDFYGASTTTTDSSNSGTDTSNSGTDTGSSTTTTG